jgi:hypothetical protein
VAIVAVLTLLLLLASGLAASTHLWWGDSFNVWWRSDGRALAAEGYAGFNDFRRWLTTRFGGSNVATSRLERFAERQSTEIQPINPFGDASEMPRRTLRALANRPRTAADSAHAASEAASETEAPPGATNEAPPVPPRTASDTSTASESWALVKVDSAMTGRILGATAQPGDVWLNLTRIEAWESRRDRRSFLIDELKQHPEWTDEDIYEIGLVLAIWNDSNAFSANRSRNRQRVRRLRQAAQTQPEQRSAAA